VISLSAKSDIGIATSGSIAIESGELKLGGSNAEQPAVLGDTFLDNLKGVMEGLQSMALFLSQEPSLTYTPAPATALNETINNFLSAIEDFKSKTVKIL
jgi:hypothetical protein